MIVVYFLSWTFALYWIHRIGHYISFIKKYHLDHHGFILRNGNPGWSWNNLLLFNDTQKSTIDLWITEVIPSFIFSWVTGQWWIIVFYYLWAALLQEIIEHNEHFNVPLLSSGRWHLIHHRLPDKNFSLFFPLWDIVFGTYKNVD
jgi:sterol desaturase/sphingolipid hydroxylase (fatty acid hydroxylase superfamily)